jgi:uncharacterized protein YeaO (DUF488 family)
MDTSGKAVLLYSREPLTAAETAEKTLDQFD